MRVYNQHHRIYLDYKDCLALKRAGLPQDNASAYWSNSDQTVHQADRISKFKGWEKLFTAAVTGEELSTFIPVFTLIEKSDAKNWRISNPRHKVTANASTEAEAKVKFICTLVKNKAIKLS